MPMSKQEKKGLVPELRFAEFKDDGEWVGAKLGEKDISLFVKEKMSLDQLTLKSYVSTENLLPDYAGVTTAKKLPSTGNFTRYKQGDILVSNIRPYLKKVWMATNEGAASNDVIVIRAKSKIKDAFLAYLLRNDNFINYVMKGAKGVKMPRGDISLMREYPVAIPTNPKEQQKIADCLNSADDLITAETQKLVTFKTHKQGLMQQLFPAKGETVPKLRFPEFRDEGEWSETTLGKLVQIRSGFSPSKYNLSKRAKYAFLKVEDLNNCAKYQVRSREYSDDVYGLVPVNSVIFPKRGAAILLNKVRINVQEVLMDTNLMAITPNKNILVEFLYYKIVSYGLFKIADNSTIPQINNKHIDPYPVLIPSKPEQQKIADCLASVDELIIEQAKKIEALKSYKKGLMQELFPVMGEVGT